MADKIVIIILINFNYIITQIPTSTKLNKQTHIPHYNTKLPTTTIFTNYITAKLMHTL